MRTASAISTRAAAPPCRASATAIPTCSRRCTRRSTALAYAHTELLHHRGRRGAGRHAGRDAPAGHRRTSTSSRGGSEAIEAALKLARQYFVEIGEPQRSVFIARRQSYHGNTLGALAVGGNEWRRAPVRAAADRRRARVAVLSNTATGARDEIAGGLRRRGSPPSSRRRSSGSAPTRVIAFVAETVGRRDRRRGAAGARLLPRACARSATATACC